MKFDLNLFQSLPEQWLDVVLQQVSEDVLLEIGLQLEAARVEGPCYPPSGQEWNALKFCSPEQVRVIICGQDPYHGPGQAHGLAFSVGPGCPFPPSLRNMLKELKDDIGDEWPLESQWDEEGVLASWARQGVLLLNDVLTVAEGQPGSHRNFGWQAVSAGILEVLADGSTPLVVILWGQEAAKKRGIFRKKDHHVIQSPHPSTLSAHRGFFGSKPFSQANEWLKLHGIPPIDWCRYHR